MIKPFRIIYDKSIRRVHINYKIYKNHIDNENRYQ